MCVAANFGAVTLAIWTFLRHHAVLRSVPIDYNIRARNCWPGHY
jgi:hypothetical protein